MCGIAGIFSLSSSLSLSNSLQPAHEAAVRRMTEAQFHRGPDDCGYLRDSATALGHRRLSILDLSPCGRQPLLSEDGLVAVVCNGEIYNYRQLADELKRHGHHFASQSDSEILVHGYEQWGIEVLLQRLRGMFAFAIRDARAGRLILARDPLGIKPLYYCYRDAEQLLVFASEARAILAGKMVPDEPDSVGLAGFLLLGSTPSPRTASKAISCLMPGHYLMAENGCVALRKYWDLDSLYDSELRDDSEQGETGGLAAALDESIRRHLISDVPVAIFLSGGVDSAGLAALATRTGAPVKTFTVATDAAEADAARDAARAFGAEHTEIPLGEIDFPSTLHSVLSAMDQPTVDGLNVWLICGAARSRGIKVALSGLGADEAFRGYKYYRWIERAGPLIGGFAGLAGARGFTGLAAAAGSLIGRESWRRLKWLDGGVSGASLYGAMRGFYPFADAARLLGAGETEMRRLAEGFLADPEVTPPRRPSCLADDYNRIEIRRYLHDQLLRDTDMFSMAHSLEVRVPYLDLDVMREALRLRPAAHAHSGIGKPALVDAIGNPIVRAAASRPKIGFALPYARWMREHGSTMRDLALRPSLLDPKEVSRQWGLFESGRLHWSRALALVVISSRHRAL